MKQIRLKLSNYHAINKADIELNGITVLTGPNGSGKSTLSRWLFYYLYCGINFESKIHEDLKDYILSILKKLDGVFIKSSATSWSQTSHNFKLILREKKLSLEEYDELYQNLIHAFKNLLLSVSDKHVRSWCINASFLSSGYESLKKKGLIKDSSRWNSKCEVLAEWLLKDYNLIKDELVSQLKERKINKVNDKIKIHFEEFESAPSSIEIEYNGLPLIQEGNFYIPTEIEHVIYVDSPFATSIPTSDMIWKTFKNLLVSIPAIELDTKVRMCRKLSQIIINGSIITKSDEVLDNKFLVYRTNNGQEYRLDKVATGVKTFAYIQRLLETGNLTSNSLLLIDEPEAHLHPQWVVELARLIVTIHKHIGVKVMIASHDPDMVAAIQAISLQEGLENSTKFYLAESSEESEDRFNYKCLDMNIGPIFESFNIALERIETYGLVK